MVYVNVVEETDERLHLSRQPNQTSWTMLVGFLAFGLGAAYYGNDHVLWKVIYVTCGLFVGLSCMDDWEDCEFDKKTGEIRLKKNSVWDMVLSPVSGKDNVIVARLSEVMRVRVEEEKVNYFGTSYQVVLIFSSGMSIGITETFTFSPTKEHEGVADKVRQFLGLDEEDVTEAAVAEDNDSSDTADEDTADDFEQIDKSELIESEVLEPSGDTGNLKNEETKDQQ